MHKIKKLIAMILLCSVIITIFPLSVSAAWKQNNSGWRYTEGNSYATGWRYIYGNWYYFSPKSGYMYSSTIIDGYFVNDNGVWINDTSFPVGALKAEALVKMQNPNYRNSNKSSGPKVKTCGFDGSNWTVLVYYDDLYKTTNIAWYYVNKDTGNLTLNY